MSRVIYSKFNSYRKPEFRIQTCIIEDMEEDGVIQRYVEKRALCKEAVSHIMNIRENHNKIKGLYKNIQVLPCREVYDENNNIDNSRIRFPYISGEPLDKEAYMDMIFGYNEEFLVPFSMSEEFKAVFPDCFPKEGIPAVKYGNLDSIPANFISVGGSAVAYDYEWVFDFPIPIDYLKYRNGISFDNNEGDVFKEKLETYKDMEERFQKYVNLAPYNINYLKDVKSIPLLKFQYDEAIVNLNGTLEVLENTKNRLSDTENRLSDTERRLCDTDARLAQTEAKWHDTETRLYEAEKRFMSLEFEHYNVINSSSWKITAPLRKIKKFLSR